MEDKPKKSKTVYRIIVIAVAVAFLIILVPPLFNLINQVETVIFGFPFSAVLIFLLGLFIAVMLVLLYHIQNKRGEL